MTVAWEMDIDSTRFKTVHCEAFPSIEPFERVMSKSIPHATVMGNFISPIPDKQIHFKLLSCYFVFKYSQNHQKVVSLSNFACDVDTDVTTCRNNVTMPNDRVYLCYGAHGTKLHTIFDDRQQ